MLAKLSLCRTAPLGERWYQCDDCHEITKLYNSCGDRHCPGCGGAKRAEWSDSSGKLLLSGVDYYQVIFTLPQILSELALANRGVLADLLFQSAWKATRKTITKEQGYDPAALMVLHTWNQKLESHWHVHALVPGGGPSLVDGSWKKAQAPQRDYLPNFGRQRKYLVDAINLRTSYRKFAINHLQRLRRDGELRFGGSLEYLRDDDAWDALVEQLESVEWVSHIEPPQGDHSRPEHVVRYLTRYLTGGPISDHRILSADDQNVRFLTREGKVVGGESRQVPYTLPTTEFVRRWCLHIQPDQLTKTRSFGGWSNTHRTDYLARCRSALDSAGLADESKRSPTPSTSEAYSRVPLPVCSHCGSDSLNLISEFRKPSWAEVLSSQSAICPVWYAESLEAEERQWWDGRMGAGFYGFYDEYLKTHAENARVGSAGQAPRSHQPWLPGLESDGNLLPTSL